jgi:hypothetical protein
MRGAVRFFFYVSVCKVNDAWYFSFIWLMECPGFFFNTPSGNARKIGNPPMILFLYIVRALFSFQSMISAAILLLALILGP